MPASQNQRRIISKWSDFNLAEIQMSHRRAVGIVFVIVIQHRLPSARNSRRPGESCFRRIPVAPHECVNISAIPVRSLRRQQRAKRSIRTLRRLLPAAPQLACVTASLGRRKSPTTIVLLATRRNTHKPLRYSDITSPPRLTHSFINTLTVPEEPSNCASQSPENAVLWYASPIVQPVHICLTVLTDMVKRSFVVLIAVSSRASSGSRSCRGGRTVGRSAPKALVLPRMVLKLHCRPHMAQAQ